MAATLVTDEERKDLFLASVGLGRFIPRAVARAEERGDAELLDRVRAILANALGELDNAINLEELAAEGSGVNFV